MEKVHNEGIGFSLAETRGQLAPTHFGTALILLSTDSPGAVTPGPLFAYSSFRCLLEGQQIFLSSPVTCRVAVESWIN